MIETNLCNHNFLVNKSEIPYLYVYNESAAYTCSKEFLDAQFGNNFLDYWEDGDILLITTDGKIGLCFPLSD